MHDFRHIAATAMTATAADNTDIRILRRVSALEDNPLAPRGDGPFRRVAIVDVETTGTNPDTDEVIDIAVVVLESTLQVESSASRAQGRALRDPGVPIPPYISRG